MSWIHERVDSSILPYRGKFRIVVYLDRHEVRKDSRDTYLEASARAEELEREVAAEIARS